MFFLPPKDYVPSDDVIRGVHESLELAKTDTLDILNKLPSETVNLMALAGLAVGVRMLSRMMGIKLKKRSYLFMVDKHWRKRYRKDFA